VGDIVQIAFQFAAPIQVPWELAEFAQVVRDASPHTFLEIGTHTGGAFFVFCQICPPDATVISMDLILGDEVYGRTPPYREFLIKRMKRPTQHYERILGDSHAEKTFCRLQRILKDEKIDFLFIDGDHSYKSVRTDFEMYAPLVRPGGIIGFHDIVKPSHDPSNEVYRFWGELKSHHQWREIIADPSPGWGGIGFIFA
jgi:predicted O-methyltransferase YrrM